MMNLNRIDALTGLYTYNVLLEYLEKTVQKVSSVGILYIELDDPARFNDTFGHDTDKKILVNVIQSISALLEDELFVRMGTYGFVIAKKEISSSDVLSSLAQKIINLLREPLSFQGNLLYMTAAIGISFSSKHQNNSFSLLKHAEYAMKDAKKLGTNRIMVSKQDSEIFYDQEFRLLKDLPYAIEQGDIYFVYQGQYSYRKDAFTGAEMLARWEHPELGNVPPSIFIPLAEKSGMITPLMTRTLVDAASMFKRLEEKGLKDFSLSINLPFQVLMEESFPDTVQFILKAYELEERNLTFEIMEDTIPDHIESFTARLNEIRNMGFSLAVDDYGTGHTSLRYLLHFPVDYIKIDRSFVQDIHKEHKRFLLFKSIIDMADALDLEVIAEGVETYQEDEVLRSFTELSVQGYLYSKPSKSETFLELFDRYSTK
jgi:diguanylate cyclase (GGDEF)-like protein